MSQENIYQDGPHLVTACFCEKVLVEKDGTKTAIRLIDRLRVSATGTADDVTEGLRQLPKQFPVTFLLKMKQGEKGDGNHSLVLKLRGPGVNDHQLMEHSLRFEGAPNQGIDLVGQIAIPVGESGTYWVDVYLNQLVITKVPFIISVTTSTLGAHSGEERLH